MKILITSLLVCCFLSSMFGQICTPDDERLSTNELNTVVNPLTLWWNGANGEFNYPNSAPTSAVFAGGLWVTAQDPAGNLATSISTYGKANGLFDFQAGPVGTGGDFSSSSYFCRSFKVSKAQIIAHVADYVDGTLDQPIPAIMEWPGRGSAMLPITALDRPLAPFVDLNADGVYQPELGEYPDFAADEAVWWVTNDFAIHGASRSVISVFVEVQVLAQAYVANNHPASKAQRYTVKLINKRRESLDSLALSLWVDPDVGCFTDDAIGSIPSKNALYAYNIDEEDGTSGSICDGGVPTYGLNPPMVFFQALNSELNGTTPSVRISGMSSNASGIGVSTSDPTLNFQYYNFAHARWSDGTPLTAGGTGYGGTEATNWIFSGNPADNSSWSQCGITEGQDRRLLLNVNLLETFLPDDEFTADFLVSLISDVELPCPDIDSVIPTLDSIADFVQNTVVSSNRTPRSAFKELTLKPNPASDVFSITIDARQATFLQSATLYDGLGRVVEQYGAAVLTGAIDVSELPRGVYSLIARDAGGEVYRSRVVLQ